MRISTAERRLHEGASGRSVVRVTRWGRRQSWSFTGSVGVVRDNRAGARAERICGSVHCAVRLSGVSERGFSTSPKLALA